MNLKQIFFTLMLAVLMFVLSACPPKCDPVTNNIRISDVNLELLRKEDGSMVTVSGNSVPANAFGLGVVFPYDIVGDLNFSSPSWNFIPSAYALSCVENLVLLDDISSVKFKSTASFGVDYPGGSDITDFFSHFNYAEFNESTDLNITGRNIYYLFELPEEELEHQFIIEIETVSGEMYRDTTETITLAL